MLTVSHVFKSLVCKQSLKNAQFFNDISRNCRNFADTADATKKSKQIMCIIRGTENEPRLRVRRARTADTSRLLHFVQQHGRAAWPALAAPGQHVVLCDYVARGLAQGHSMLVEQLESRRGSSQVRGLALCLLVCPWDHSLLEQWARCVRGPRARRLLSLAAHCLRAPELHHKYRVHKLMQVILIIPLSDRNNTEIINLLAKNAIKRGKEADVPLIRFDATSDNISKTLEELSLKKEWQLSYDVSPEDSKSEVTNKFDSIVMDATDKNRTDSMDEPPVKQKYPYQIAVYTTELRNNKETSNQK